MSDDQRREPKGSGSGGRFKSTPGQEPILHLGLEETAPSRADEKATRNLEKTLAALRSSLDKGRELVALGRAKFDEDWIVQDAAITVVTQIAEEAKRLPKAFKVARPEVPWRNVIGMRDIVIHEYSIVDLPLVWEALEVSFPQIEESVFRDKSE